MSNLNKIYESLIVEQKTGGEKKTGKSSGDKKTTKTGKSGGDKKTDGQTTTKPQVQPTDDGIPKPASGGDIKIQLMDTRTRLYVQSPEFVSAIQKALNKGNDYSSNNIFK
jgi:hypothetical protein